MQPLELLSGLVQLDLSSLGFSYFFIQFFLLLRHEDSQVLDLQLEFLYLGLVCPSVFF